MIDDFRPVSHLAKPDVDITIDKDDNISEVTPNSNPNRNSHNIPKSKKSMSKKKKRIVALVILVAVIGLTGLALILYKHNPKPKTSSSAKTSSAPAGTIIRSRLTGLPVTAVQAALPVSAIMIENSTAARPQSGLSQAGVVFEALAEGGITRFVALYEEGQPSSIGPVRSARPYFIDWMLPFDAAYIHVGGSPDALNQIKADNVKDLNQFYFGNYFTRISSRQAPHNVYISSSQIQAMEKSQGYTTSNFTGFPRKNDQPSKQPTATSIDFNMSGPDYAVHYDYNKATNSYLRSEGGAPMIGANSGKQLDPKVVIAVVVPLSEGTLDSSGAYYSVYGDIGSGAAYIFQDGIVTQGIWSKASITSQILFGNANGSPMALNAGQTWITAVSSSNDVIYKN